MSFADGCREFDNCGGDHAVPGDPWSRLRYHYGQLLGAEDFAAEQRAGVLRHRLHLGLLHGSGCVWGLEVTSTEEGSPPATRLEVAPGLAVDPLGREIYVDRQQCLDITALHARDFWNELEEHEVEDEAGASIKVKRLYVVLYYEACMSQPVPAIAEPCSGAEEASAFSRLNDRFSIHLTGTPPEAHELQRAWLRRWRDVDNAGGWNTLRDRLLETLMRHVGPEGSSGDPPPNLARYWTGHDAGGVLLAEIDAIKDEGAAEAVTRVHGDIRNGVRPLLPPAQLLAEELLGQRVGGADERKPVKVRRIELSRPDSGGGMALAVELTDEVLEGVVKDQQGIRAERIDGGKWASVQVQNVAVAGNVINAKLNKNFVDGEIYAIHLNGAGLNPIISADGRPLAGWWDEATPENGRGRDVSVVRTWHDPN
jgi:hypothetical protein